MSFSIWGMTMAMTKQSDRQQAPEVTSQRCIRCQGRRDERAVIFKKLRAVRKQTGDLLRKFGQTKPPESSDTRFYVEDVHMVEHMRLLNTLTMALFKVLREYPIKHDNVGDCSTMIPLTASHKTTVH